MRGPHVGPQGQAQWRQGRWRRRVAATAARGPFGAGQRHALRLSGGQGDRRDGYRDALIDGRGIGLADVPFADANQSGIPDFVRSSNGTACALVSATAFPDRAITHQSRSGGSVACTDASGAQPRTNVPEDLSARDATGERRVMASCRDRSWKTTTRPALPSHPRSWHVRRHVRNRRALPAVISGTGGPAILCAGRRSPAHAFSKSTRWARGWWPGPM